MYPVVVMAQDAPEDEPYPAVVFPDGSWLPYKKVMALTEPISDGCFATSADCIHIQEAALSN